MLIDGKNASICSFQRVGKPVLRPKAEFAAWEVNKQRARSANTRPKNKEQNHESLQSSRGEVRAKGAGGSAFGELEAFASALLTVLLALVLARIARQHS